MAFNFERSFAHVVVHGSSSSESSDSEGDLMKSPFDSTPPIRQRYVKSSKKSQPTGKLWTKIARKSEPVDSVVITSDSDICESPRKEEMRKRKRPVSPSTVKSEKVVCVDVAENDEQDKSDDDDEVPLFNGRRDTPIFCKSREGLSVLDIFRAVIEQQSENVICHSRPTGVQTNAVFLLDLDNIDFRNLSADDNGAWRVASPRRQYTMTFKGTKVQSVGQASGNDIDGAYTLIRQYGTHIATKAKQGVVFQRIISRIYGPDNQLLKRAVIQYLFKDHKEVPLTLVPHQNSKRTSSKPYMRTAPSTLQDLREKTTRMGPKQACEDVYEAAGGLLRSTTMSSEPRNMKQVYNLKIKNEKKNEKKDEMFELLEQLKIDQQKPDKGFVRKVQFSDTPETVLASQQQLTDIVRFCTGYSSLSVWGIDPTFNLGNFYVTLTTYRHPFLINPRTQKHPVFLGPAFVHMRRETENYDFFFHSLLSLEPKLIDLNAYGTDGEVALLNALVINFPPPRTIGLRCYLHKQHNIEDQLQNKFKVGREIKREIIKDLFRDYTDDVLSSGLIDAESPEEFDVQLASVEDKWESIAPGFYGWFVREHSDNFKETLIAVARERAGLKPPGCGQPPELYSDNGNESANAKVKSWVEHSKSSWPEFNDKLGKLVGNQYVEAEKALYGAGDYLLADGYKHLGISSLQWHRLDSNGRNKLLSKFRGFQTLQSTCTSVSQDSPFPDPPVGTSNVELSMQQEEIVDSLKSVPAEAVRGMLAKATKLLQKGPDAIVLAPGNACRNAFIVESSSGKPHFVAVKQKGKVMCDGECPQWRGKQICSHSIAVAESIGELESFIKWRGKSKRETSLAKMVLTGAPAGAGSKSAAKRWGSVNRNKQPVHTVSKRHKVTQRPSASANAPTSTSTSTSTTNNDTQRPKSRCAYKPSPPAGAFEFCLLQLCDTRVSTCYGCRNFLRLRGQETLLPPHDLIIVSKMRREYMAGEERRLGPIGNVYFHCRVDCIKAKQPMFLPNLVFCPPPVRGLLTETHIQFIESTLGVQL